MRACFLGSNVCGLGFGVAVLNSHRLAPERSRHLAPVNEAYAHRAAAAPEQTDSLSQASAPLASEAL